MSLLRWMGLPQPSASTSTNTTSTSNNGANLANGSLSASRTNANASHAVVNTADAKRFGLENVCILLLIARIISITYPMYAHMGCRLRKAQPCILASRDTRSYPPTFCLWQASAEFALFLSSLCLLLHIASARRIPAYRRLTPVLPGT